MIKKLFLVIPVFSFFLGISQGSNSTAVFDGNDYFTISSNAGNSLSGWENFTISGWIYQTNSGGYRTIFDKVVNVADAGKCNIHIDISPTNFLRFNMNKEGVAWEDLTSTERIPINKWVHFACVKNLNQTTIYINGIACGTKILNDVLTANSNDGYDICIGRLRRSNQFFFTGRIDEICYFKTALTQTQIRDWMCKKIDNTHPVWATLVGYWRFDEGSGNVINDQTINGNNGTHNATAEWAVSGAAIGDQSAYLYPASWTGNIVSLNSTAGDRLTISDLTAAAASGAHIYRVNSLPNSTTGITSVGQASYYGVYLTDTTGSFTVKYLYSDFTTQCDACNPLYSRNDNSQPAWIAVPATHGSCMAAAINQSQVGDIHRAEYYASIQNLNIDLGGDQEFCDGGSVNLDGTMVAGATYLWHDASFSPFYTAVSSGTCFVNSYYEGCLVGDTILVTVNPNPVAFAGADQIFDCFTTTLTLDGSGSSSGVGFSYLWTTPDGNIVSGANTTNPVIDQPGVYTLTVSNSTTGCTASDVTDIIQDTGLPTADAGSDLVINCYNPTQTLDGSGSSTGTDITYNWITTDGNIVSGVSGLSPVVDQGGTYTLQVTNQDNGCVATDLVVVTTDLVNPVASAGSDLVLSCTVSSVSPDASGSSAGAGISYQWSTTDGNIVSGQTSQNPEVDQAGTYSLLVTNTVNGCTDSDDISVLEDEDMPVANAGSDMTLDCFVTSVLLNGSGSETGTDISYSWTTNDGNIATGAASLTVEANQPGTYTIHVTDNSNGCVATDNVLVTFVNNLSAAFTIDAPACFDETTTVTYTGNASAIADYFWNFNGADILSGSGDGPYLIQWSAPGYYDIQLTISQNNCVAGPELQPVIYPGPVTTTINGSDMICFGSASGSINLEVSGGTDIFSYQWSNGSNTQDQSALTAGNYQVTITDSNGCVENETFDIAEYPELVLGMNPETWTCIGHTALVHCMVSGGLPPYSYLWNNGNITSSMSVTPTGSTWYSITVTDQAGCIRNSGTMVDVYPALYINVSPEYDSVCPGEPVVIESLGYGGGDGGPYMITIDGEIISFPYTLETDETEIIEITIEDVCGSPQATDQVEIVQVSSPEISISADITGGCEPVEVHFNVNDGDDGYEYEWVLRSGATTYFSHIMNPVFNIDESGDYDVTVNAISDYGCVSVFTDPEMIHVYPKPESRFAPDKQVVSIVHPVVDFYNYSVYSDMNIWSFGDGNTSFLVSPVHEYPLIGKYTVTLEVISEYGCRDTSTTTIWVEDQYTFYAPDAFTPNNDGINDYFFVLGNGIVSEKFNFYIYDRWGELVFESVKYFEDNPELHGWDGRIKGGDYAPSGVYTWLVKFTDEREVQREKAGTVTLLR
ncbi:MAG: hypothetical protein A2W91_20395 [Bacteroidetes bacterium GWF2_38_335]|nr:MAG: hypothetical protein A2W91_20395 [Bacteroidetes bacterium GWF2_38_335]OFY79481.1 MAG: hypothetical protein A2281_13690 [Bacteroidetes bacterium RIFOXYA12_FULL_38_20]HBS86582.1 hypothetical protein [Bacteroidales bacterium]